MITLRESGIGPTQDELRRIAREAVSAIVAGTPPVLQRQGRGLQKALQGATRAKHPGSGSGDEAELSADQWWKLRGPKPAGSGYDIAILATKTVHDKAGEQYNLLHLLMSGTKSHEITGDPYLAWSAGGEDTVRRGTITHPGTRPDRFIEQAVQDYKPELVRAVSAGAHGAVVRLLKGTP